MAPTRVAPRATTRVTAWDHSQKLLYELLHGLLARTLNPKGFLHPKNELLDLGKMVEPTEFSLQLGVVSYDTLAAATRVVLS